MKVAAAANGPKRALRLEDRLPRMVATAKTARALADRPRIAPAAQTGRSTPKKRKDKRIATATPGTM